MNEKTAIDPDEQLPPTTESHRQERPGEPAPAPRPDPPAPAPEAVRPEEFFPPQRRDQLKGTWLDIQSAFIDEPRRAVQNADGLVKEILGAVSQRFESARHSLEEEWNRGEQASTEALRIALKRYRALFDRLLSL